MAKRVHVFLAVFVALVALYLLFFHRLGERDLWSSHEARAAMDAESILAGEWDLPHLNDGRAELQKPPLYYWLVALTARLRGGVVDAWAVRLPATLSAVGCVLLLAWFGRRVGRPGTGLLAAAVLATAIHFPWLARIGRIDMPLAFSVSVACVAFYRPNVACGAARPRVLPVIGYLAVSAAILLKGPIGAVLPASVWLAQRLLSPRTPNSELRTPNSFWWGVPLVLIVTLPWFVWATMTTGGEFFRVFIVYHNIDRGLGSADLKAHPWWLYVPYFAGDFLPWTPLLLAAGLLCWQRGWWRVDPELRFGLIWLAAVIGVLSCSSFKRADYLLPAYPGAALFLACAVSRLAQSWQSLPTRLIRLRFALAALALAVVVGWTVHTEIGLRAEEPFRDYTRFAAAIRAAAPQPEEVLFFQTEAHALAFHVGRPLEIIVEWDQLQARLAEPTPAHVVMPPQCAAVWRDHLTGIRLCEMLRNTDLNSGRRHERPLVLLRAEREPTPCPTSRSCLPSPKSH